MKRLPQNRTGATIDNVIAVNVNPAARETSHDEALEGDADCNYTTVTRWKRRLELWKEYMTSNSASQRLPDATKYYFCKNPTGDYNSIEKLIWRSDGDGAGDDSLESMISELASLQSDNAQINLASGENSNMSDEHLALFRMFLKERDARIKDRDARIKEREAHIKAELNGIHERHDKTRIIISWLADKGNETAGTAACYVYFDEKRIDKRQPDASKVQEICEAKSDANFLKELMEKDAIISKKEDLCKLQTYVTALLKNADVVEKREIGVDVDVDDKKIKASVDAILKWTPETTVGSLRRRKGEFGRPPSTGCEAFADQPILCALMFRILALLGQTSTSVSSEQVLAHVGHKGKGRRIDFVVDECRVFLHGLFPEKLGRAIEVKPAAQDDHDVFESHQRKAREQVMGHLAKQLLCAFDFGGIGQDDVVCGVVLSMVSVQVLEMKLTRIGTDEVDIVFRQTPHVPFLAETNDLQNIHHAVDWDMGSNGVLLLASAMLDISRKSMFSNGRLKTKVDDVSAAKYFSMNSQELERHVGNEIQSLLGSGSFAHVVKTGDKMFMKIPRSRRMVRSLTREFEILRELEPGDKPWFPRIMPWGVSIVNLSIRNEISQLKVLQLKGIVGCSLGSYCKYNHPNMREDCHRVIQEVYKALEFAHSKGIFHMDVRPSNIIVASQGNGHMLDVLLADWGSSMLRKERIGNNRFVGCTPYAHDKLLGKRLHRSLKPTADYDFASLGFTWYHTIRGVIGWQFDRPALVSVQQLEDRRTKMQEFFQSDIGEDTACLVPKVRNMYIELRRGSRKRTLSKSR